MCIKLFCLQSKGCVLKRERGSRVGSSMEASVQINEKMSSCSLETTVKMGNNVTYEKV